MIHCTDSAEAILDSDVYLLRLMKNVTYTIPLMAQINFQKYAAIK